MAVDTPAELPTREEPSTAPTFAFDNTYVRELGEGFSVRWHPAPVQAPRLLYLNRPLASELRLDADALEGAAGAALFSGNALPADAEPVAQAYAGHQFGGFSPQLGDGRALLIGELIDTHGQRRDIALKGSGRTPFSRGGDGKAAVGPMLREALVSEAMHALGIPTTRSLAVVATGEAVYREKTLPGAVLTRVASSHIRVGTFQFYAARSDHERLRALAEYTIARHDPELVGTDDRYLGLLRHTAQRHARLIAQWMNVGFIHGVMNTDNMTISGETIDYGPCAFMEAYDPDAVFSSIDHQGRYRYSNQPRIARWNLARFAETLLPLIEGDESQAVARATEIIDAFPGWYEAHLRRGRMAKLGLEPAAAADAGGTSASTGRSADRNEADAADVTDAADVALGEDWLALLAQHRVDFTLGWRRLADAAEGNDTPLRKLFGDAAGAPDAWLERWRQRCRLDDTRGGRSAGKDASHRRAERMRQVNPFVIPRNHRVEEALSAASEHDDLGPFHRLLTAITHPWDEGPEQQRYGEPAPAAVTACYQTFCGT